MHKSLGPNTEPLFGKHRQSWVVFLVAVGCAALIFYVPYYVPVTPSVAFSYTVGYNNRAGVVLLSLCLLAWGFYSRRLRYKFPVAPLRDSVRASQVWRWSAAFAVAAAVMYFLVHGLNGFGESPYLIDRLFLLSEGKVPYRDFEYAYGPFFLYGPYLFAKLHLSLDAAYYLFWVLCLVGGVVLLARTLDLMERPQTGRPALFQMFCYFALTAVITTGVNYTLVRFIVSPFLALWIARLDRRAVGGGRTSAIAASALATIVVLLVSPEMGMAFAVGSIAYFALVPPTGDRQSWIRWIDSLLGCSALQAAILLIANRLHLFDTLRMFSGGAYAFPVMPAAHILLFILCAGLCAALIFAWKRELPVGHGQLMVLAVSAGTLFAALGRCDAGHVGFSGLGILLVAATLIRDRPSRWRWFRIAFLLVFVLSPAVETLWLYRALVGKAVILRIFQAEPQGVFTSADRLAERFMRRSLGEPQARTKFELLKASSSLPRDLDLKTLYPEASGSVQAPFGFMPNRFGVYHDPRIETGYYDSLVNVLTPQAVERKIMETRKHPDQDLLLPENVMESCVADPLGEEKRIRALFLFPYYASIRNKDNLWSVLCDSIRDHYDEMPVVSTRYGYRLWRPRSGS